MDFLIKNVSSFLLRIRYYLWSADSLVLFKGNVKTLMNSKRSAITQNNWLRIYFASIVAVNWLRSSFPISWITKQSVSIIAEEEWVGHAYHREHLTKNSFTVVRFRTKKKTVEQIYNRGVMIRGWQWLFLASSVASEYRGLTTRSVKGEIRWPR